MPLTGVQQDTLSQSEREAVAGTVALARHARGPQATGPGAGRPALLVGRRDRYGLALPRARAGWHDSCFVVHTETCARHPGWNSPRRQDDRSSTRGCAWGEREEPWRKEKIMQTLWLLGGLGLGAGLMYLLDSEKGDGRRERVRGYVVDSGRQTGALLDDTRRTLGQQAQAVLATTRRPFKRQPGLGERLRTQAAQRGMTTGIALVG